MNEHATTPFQPSPQRRPWRWFGVLAIGCVLLSLLWGGCDTKRDYEVLSFFFDGVPDPNAPPDVIRQRVQRKLGVNYFKHKPYDEKNCKACHTSFTFAGLNPNESVCLQCHDQITNQFPLMHAPVITNDCLWCHDPHESYEKHLLRQPDNMLCIECHDRGGFLGPNPPAHMDEARSCLECHFGHGAMARHFLKPLQDQIPEGPVPAAPDVEAPEAPQPEGTP